jgi:hypothetical protein
MTLKHVFRTRTHGKLSNRPKRIANGSCHDALPPHLCFACVPAAARRLSRSLAEHCTCARRSSLSLSRSNRGQAKPKVCYEQAEVLHDLKRVDR